MRYGLRNLLEQQKGWTVCGEAEDGLDTLKKAVSLKPDVIVLDISMPKLDGLKAVPLLRYKVPDSEIIILTIHECIEMARIAANAGAKAYVAKSLLFTDLVPTIRRPSFR